MIKCYTFIRISLLNFRKLPITDKVAVATAATAVLGVIFTATTYIASTDTVQKIHIKYKLLNIKFLKPQHMKKVSFILF